MGQDNKAPVWETINLSYDSIKNAFNISARATDDSSGITTLYYYCKNPSGTQEKNTRLSLNPISNLYAGTYSSK